MASQQHLSEPQPSEQYNLVTFLLEKQIYALPIQATVQIIEMVTITPIPQVDDAVQGVINVRGEPVLVINLRRHLGLPQMRLQLRTPIILVQSAGRMMGLIVDQVIDMLSLSASQIVHPNAILPKKMISTSLLQGMAHTPEGTVLLLDLDQLFQPHHKESLAAVAAHVVEKR
jgi:chemotaxis signal transduction protein